MYYIKCLYFYSLIGFILESDIYKINNSNIHSGIFYGPITMVYGFGILSLVLLKKYFFDKLKINKFFKLLIVFVCSFVFLTLIEFLGGTILNILFDIDMWNYSKKAFNCGKYICLELSFIWGVLGTLFVYFVKDFLDRFIKLIPNNFIYVVIVINVIDIFLVFLTK